MPKSDLMAARDGIWSRGGVPVEELPDPFTLQYGDKRGTLKFTQFTNMTAITGYIELTSIGWQLFHGIPVQPSSAVWGYLRDHWTNQSHLAIVDWDAA